MNKKELRKTFRNSVFKRDKFCCKKCNKPGKDKNDENSCKSFHKLNLNLVYLDAHHITDRSEIANQGYVVENGISLCSDCHLLAEQYHLNKGEKWADGFHPNDLYVLIQSSKEKAISASELL